MPKNVFWHIKCIKVTVFCFGKIHRNTLCKTNTGSVVLLELIRLISEFWCMIVNANASSSSDNTMPVFIKSVN